MPPCNQRIGSHQETSSPRPVSKFALYAIFAVLTAGNVILGLALLMTPELSRYLEKGSDPILAAYETRILHLRLEVDRLNSRQYVQAGNLNLRLQELLQQQEILKEQQDFIRVLAQQAQDLGIATASLETSPPLPDPVTPAGVSSDPATQNDMTASITLTNNVANSLRTMVSESNSLFSSISDSAEQSANSIIGQLDTVGLAPHLPDSLSQDDLPVGMGGPLIDASSDLSSRAQSPEFQAILALARFRSARQALVSAPVHKPMASLERISSPFGRRRDPFGGTSAFHSGIDYPAPAGTSVFTTGNGRVVFAGLRNGYGKLIEIDHGNGIISRYAHLSRILVEAGQTVEAGNTIGRVGSTGRSTGPHLHFEIRRNQTAVNPADFLAISQNLRQYLI